jgi:uncharacterized protein (TIGR00661 family)
MRYVFIVQGEGRGHMTQAITLRNILVSNGHEVVEILMGTSPNRVIPSFFVEKINTTINTFQSPNFSPIKRNKKQSTLKSILFNIPRIHHYVSSVRFIHKRIKTLNPDRVINFYDVLGGITYQIFKIQNPMICIAHQYIFMHQDFKFPKKSKSEIAGLLLFTKLTCLKATKVLALSFGNFREFHEPTFSLVPPLLRQEVINAQSEKGDFILGYILNPHFETQIREWHTQHPEFALRFFWDNKTADEITQIDNTLSFYKLNDVKFIDNMKSCMAYATTGGFESICEALYLEKPVLMVPAHIEQECNVVDAMNVGAGIYSKEFDIMKLIEFTQNYHPSIDFKPWVLGAEEIYIQHLTNPITSTKKNEQSIDYLWIKAFFRGDMYMKAM